MYFIFGLASGNANNAKYLLVSYSHTVSRKTFTVKYIVDDKTSVADVIAKLRSTLNCQVNDILVSKNISFDFVGVNS